MRPLNSHAVILVVCGLILTAFLAISIFGYAYSNMQMGSNGHMSGCVFAGTGICTMSPLQHADHLREMLTAVIAFPILALLVSAIIGLISVGFFARLFTRDYADWICLHPIFRQKRLALLRSRMPLQEAYATGRLNSKVFWF